MSAIAEQITIAITVYDRRDYIEHAIESALNQTVPVKVIVVEDCGPDPGLKSFIQGKFGDRIEYFRNDRRRGLFDNWNACIELCSTPFVSILHDDDLLHPEFVAAMKELISYAPDCGLYFGETDLIDQKGKRMHSAFPLIKQSWRRVTFFDFAKGNPLWFPGQLIRTDSARAIGGFRPTSQFCGDYEMWTKMAARFGAAQIGRTICSARQHRGWNRGTTRAERSGKIKGLVFVQQKRIGAILRARGYNWSLNRKEYLQTYPQACWYLIRYAYLFSPRILKYNYQLLVESPSPNWRHALLQMVARLFGPEFLKTVSKVYRFLFSPFLPK